jgi:hypothetical protein
MMFSICNDDSFFRVSNMPQWKFIGLLSSSLVHLEFNAVSTDTMGPSGGNVVSARSLSGGTSVGCEKRPWIL